jgi:predicted nuclease of predicted toxin-antitoxin system
MTARFYFDQHMPRAIVVGLRQLGVDVLRTQDDGTERLPDEQLLERATALGRVLVTADDDFLALARDWMRAGRPFAGIVHVRHPHRLIGRLISDLHVYAYAAEPSDLTNQVTFLP